MGCCCTVTRSVNGNGEGTGRSHRPSHPSQLGAASLSVCYLYIVAAWQEPRPSLCVHSILWFNFMRLTIHLRRHCTAVTNTAFAYRECMHLRHWLWRRVTVPLPTGTVGTALSRFRKIIL